MLNGDCHFNIYMYYTSWVLSRCREAYSARCIGEWKSVECVVWTQAFVQTQILCIRHVDLWVINNDTNTCMKSKPNNHLKTDCVIICMKWAGDYGWFHGIVCWQIGSLLSDILVSNLVASFHGMWKFVCLFDFMSFEKKSM